MPRINEREGGISHSRPVIHCTRKREVQGEAKGKEIGQQIGE